MDKSICKRLVETPSGKIYIYFKTKFILMIAKSMQEQNKSILIASENAAKVYKQYRESRQSQ